MKKKTVSFFPDGYSMDSTLVMPSSELGDQRVIQIHMREDFFLIRGSGETSWSIALQQLAGKSSYQVIVSRFLVVEVLKIFKASLVKKIPKIKPVLAALRSAVSRGETTINVGTDILGALGHFDQSMAPLLNFYKGWMGGRTAAARITLVVAEDVVLDIRGSEKKAKRLLRTIATPPMRGRRGVAPMPSDKPPRPPLRSVPKPAPRR